MPLGGLVTAGVITGAVTAATAVGSAIAGTKNAKLRRQYEANLAALSQTEKAKLEKQIKEAKTKEERNTILAETLGQTAGARIAGIEQQKLESKKTFNKLVIIGSITIAVILTGLAFYKAKSKK